MNIIKGIAGVVILLLGVGVILGFTTGFFDESFPWVIIAIVGIIVVIVISGILILPRARIQRLSRTHEFRTDQHNREYHEKVQRREDKNFTSKQKHTRKKM